MVVVVTGMHASGTSLVAHCLREMGVYMGEQFMGPVKGMPTWEDKLFFRLNAVLLAHAGGNWSRPPAMERISEVCQQTKTAVLMTVSVRLREHSCQLWGWKDPRNCLTVHVWHPLLTEPRYICTRRDHDAIARSILARGRSKMSHAEWVDLAREYDRRVQTFLKSVSAPRFQIQFEDLIHKAKADQVLEGLARFLDIRDEAQAVEKALRVIKFR